MPKFVVVLIMSCFTLLSACTGLSKQDFRQISSMTSLNNNVSIKRYRQVVISPVSTIALQVSLMPSNKEEMAVHLRDKQLILKSFKQHFRRVELFEMSDLIGDDFDFIVNVNLLSIDRTPKKLSDENLDVDVSDSTKLPDANVQNNVLVEQNTTNSLESINVAEASSTKAETTALPSESSFTPLQALMKLSLFDARSNQIIDVAVVESFSSTIRKPSFDDFLMDTINSYANKITIM